MAKKEKEEQGEKGGKRGREMSDKIKITLSHTHREIKTSFVSSSKSFKLQDKLRFELIPP